MRQISFLVPGTTKKFHGGGLNVELQASRVLQKKFPNKVVTYRQREKAYPFFEDELDKEGSKTSTLWIISWGYDIPELLRKLHGRAIAYHAHSTGYNFHLPRSIPILAVSKNTLGYWGAKAPSNPLFLVQNSLEPHWLKYGNRINSHASDPGVASDRRIDVLVQTKKNSAYVINELVPALKRKGIKVYLQSEWIKDIVGLYNNSKVILYDSSEYWNLAGLSEGFGLTPLEAISCGCIVFSSLNHGLSDVLIPGRVGYQLGSNTLGMDVQRICAAVKNPNDWVTREEDLQVLMKTHNEEELLKNWSIALKSINQHWDNQTIYHYHPLYRSNRNLNILTLVKKISIKYLRKIRMFIRYLLAF
ncbi:glycosyltransferase [Prochlorococcus sp. MIT 1341]|uniref:glycosyltransferase n=1 Tax=Prochlorococcus sp. MIT 1341 TaxID=3096221 RepID=UPI002A762315|nr:glycosyltransferase [Prochlorococcus sp. MIT 1341]